MASYLNKAEAARYNDSAGEYKWYYNKSSEKYQWNEYPSPRGYTYVLSPKSEPERAPMLLINPDKTHLSALCQRRDNTLHKDGSIPEVWVEPRSSRSEVQSRRASWNLSKHGYIAGYLIAGLMTVVLLVLAFTLSFGLFIVFAPVPAWETYTWGKKARRMIAIDTRPEDFYLSTKNPYQPLGLEERLGDVLQRYEDNKQSLAVADARLVEATDENEFYRFAWKVGQDIRKLQKVNSLGRNKPVIEQGIHRIAGELDKLQQAVENLSDVAVINVVEKVESSYYDPTVADRLADLAKNRLNLHQELLAGDPPSQEETKLKEADRLIAKVAMTKPVPVVKPVQLSADMIASQNLYK